MLLEANLSQFLFAKGNASWQGMPWKLSTDFILTKHKLIRGICTCNCRVIKVDASFFFPFRKKPYTVVTLHMLPKAWSGCGWLPTTIKRPAWRHEQRRNQQHKRNSPNSSFTQTWRKHLKIKPNKMRKMATFDFYSAEFTVDALLLHAHWESLIYDLWNGEMNSNSCLKLILLRSWSNAGLYSTFAITTISAWHLALDPLDTFRPLYQDRFSQLNSLHHSCRRLYTCCAMGLMDG